jgi:uncharacterized protein (DUF427 family)
MEYAKIPVSFYFHIGLISPDFLKKRPRTTICPVE